MHPLHKMPHVERATPSQGRASDEFRITLCMQQPEVVIWLEQHLQGAACEIAIELATRYFEVAERWGDRMPILKKSRLNIELARQVPSINPQDRWLTELPVAAPGPDRLAIGRLLRAMVSVSKACL